MITVLLDFAKKAGDEMKARRKSLHALGNKDGSVSSLVTTTDIAVSDLFEKTVKENFSALNYMIIDEEKISKYGENIFDAVEKTDYQFAIDPVDGTVQYAYGHPLYGISIGVYKKTKPLYGIVYLPELNELTYFDGQKAYLVENAFRPDEIRSEIKPFTKSDSPVIFAHSWLWDLSAGFSTGKALVFDYYSAVSKSLYTLTGKAKAYCINCKLWDIAGTLPIAQYLGLYLREYGTSVVYDRISPAYFNPDMTVKNPCVLCCPEDYDNVCALVEPKR